MTDDEVGLADTVTEFEVGEFYNFFMRGGPGDEGSEATEVEKWILCYLPNHSPYMDDQDEYPFMIVDSPGYVPERFPDWAPQWEPMFKRTEAVPADSFARALEVVMKHD